MESTSRLVPATACSSIRSCPAWDEKVAAITGKVEVPGLIRFRLANPGAALPDVEIAYEIVPGIPNILNIPDWAETTFRPDGQNLRDKIRE